MKNKKRGKSGPKVKIKHAYRGCWNIEGRHKRWLELKAGIGHCSESEVIRELINNDMELHDADTKAI